MRFVSLLLVALVVAASPAGARQPPLGVPPLPPAALLPGPRLGITGQLAVDAPHIFDAAADWGAEAGGMPFRVAFAHSRAPGDVTRWLAGARLAPLPLLHVAAWVGRDAAGDIAGPVRSAEAAAKLGGLRLQLRYTAADLFGTLFRDTTVLVDSAVQVLRIPSGTKRSARFTDAEVGYVWRRGALSLEGWVAGRLGEPEPLWARVGASLDMTPALALAATLGRAPSAPATGLDARSFYSLGIVWRPGAERMPSAAKPARSAATSFTARMSGRETVQFRVLAPAARSVEVTGDFSDWQPIPLTRGSDGTWSADYALRPGTWRIDLRIDGGPWQPPPGLPTLRDEFGGEVGVLEVGA